jgi:predicted small secreted protein
MVRIPKLRTTHIVLMLVGIGALALASCNTTEGLGKDVENLGENIQDTAD